MSSSQDLGQLLLMGVPGTELTPETAARLKKLQPGGFILFGRNIQSPQQLRKLIDDLRDLSDVEPFITIDQEGGRVSRLRLIGEEPPNAQSLRDKGDPALIKRHGKLTGQILRLFGFNLDLCPVLDISYDDAADNSLKGRTYGRDPQQVIDNAGIFNRSMRAEGILSCGKHFPGYGPAECDPHEFLPVITKSHEEMERSELLPYSALLPELDSVMTCHSNYTAYDPDRGRWPASLSYNIVTKLLRHQYSFDGLAMTDDLDMGAILNEVTFEQAIQEAVRAGNDLVMICHRVEMVELARQHLEGVEAPALHDALMRVEKTKKRLVKPDAFNLDRFAAINRDILQLRIDTLGEEAAKVLSVEDGKRSPVELY
ncbi:glycoside hydrolase family 3 protein [Prosthecobacter vanneervenii]|uniref:beta-N-acetylhexosaminidase n=1 Tax=Prosthecobacter vanneervenii TaxID=48466 RepID=A0A7W8DKW4_9BACT|nr:glycoside hydrolase family 3 protein [Prosthecobacter vanneervenii]MBB5033572.1 beta-N-acetylhexosaminidase [Prosthecobacter vanneervenii]